jgi:thioredoxin 1
MLERIALVALLSAAGLAGFYLLRLAHVRRMSPVAVVTGVPTLLYFRSNTCAVCPTQSRMIEQVAAAWNGRLVIEQIDAEAEPDKAGRYQVFTLPTTILLDGNGTVQRVNYGLADDRKLTRQLAELDAVAV